MTEHEQAAELRKAGFMASGHNLALWSDCSPGTQTVWLRVNARAKELHRPKGMPGREERAQLAYDAWRAAIGWPPEAVGQSDTGYRSGWLAVADLAASWGAPATAIGAMTDEELARQLSEAYKAVTGFPVNWEHMPPESRAGYLAEARRARRARELFGAPPPQPVAAPVTAEALPPDATTAERLGRELLKRNVSADGAWQTRQCKALGRAVQSLIDARTAGLRGALEKASDAIANITLNMSIMPSDAAGALHDIHVALGDIPARRPAPPATAPGSEARLFKLPYPWSPAPDGWEKSNMWTNGHCLCRRVKGDAS